MAYTVDMSAIPFTREGFYATNNQFQRTGPKGFIEVKVVENDNLYVRVDMPGVPNDAVHHRIDGVRKKVVFFSGETPKENELEEAARTYSGCAGLGCDCCEITGVNANMQNGVLRIVISRLRIQDAETKCTQVVPPFTGKTGRYLEDHPYVVNGPKRAFFAKMTSEGSLYSTFDIPGASAVDTRVFIHEDEVRFYAESKKVSEHDESGRVYLGSVSNSRSVHFTDNDFTWEVNHGVLKIVIKDRLSNDNDDDN